MVLVSFISFLLSLNSIPARVALLVTLFLTLTNILIAQQAESPSSGKFTALGIYLLTSLIFIVAAFIEFAFILLLQQRNDKQLQNQHQLWKWKHYWNGSTRSNEMQDNSMDNEIIK